MKKFTDKLAQTSAQHTLEYATILILVMAGIIIAGPLVIRSWNANMQGWEDSVIDSFEDPFIQAPDVIALPGCTCEIQPGEPGLDCGLSFCAETELFEQCICNPPGCGFSDPASQPCVEGSGQCVCDTSCCSTPTPTGNCGAPACPDGEMEVTFDCGQPACGGSTQTTCQPDPACSFGCTQPLVPPPNSLPCPGYAQSLTADRSNILVGTCTGTVDHCELFCEPPYFPVAGNTGCGLCPAGSVIVGNCPPGAGTYRCEQSVPCTSGQCALAP